MSGRLPQGEAASMTRYSATVRCPACRERTVSLSSRSVLRYGDGLAADWQIESAECGCFNELIEEADATLENNREAHAEARDRGRDEFADLQRDLRREA